MLECKEGHAFNGDTAPTPDKKMKYMVIIKVNINTTKNYSFSGLHHFNLNFYALLTVRV